VDADCHRRLRAHQGAPRARPAARRQLRGIKEQSAVRIVDVGFFSKGAAKSQVAIGHRKLASLPDAARMKTFWSEKLQALAELLAPAEKASR